MKKCMICSIEQKEENFGKEHHICKSCLKDANKSIEKDEIYVIKIHEKYMFEMGEAELVENEYFIYQEYENYERACKVCKNLNDRGIFDLHLTSCRKEDSIDFQD